VPDDLFPETILTPGLTYLPRYVAGKAPLLDELDAIVAAAPFRQMSTPGGNLMSVAMSNCGAVGWVTDRKGYRYAEHDPLTGAPWPAMPASWLALAAAAAEAGGFPGFTPDACLINRYVPGAKMTLHQDRDEADFSAPIVSVSLGLPATFLWGGAARTDRAARIQLNSGDVLVWGGDTRLNFHGILPLKPGAHPRLGATRINLTFRKAR
jgi:alkylated DNA repair protein (DNA oxidative demethylase)